MQRWIATACVLAVMSGGSRGRQSAPQSPSVQTPSVQQTGAAKKTTVSSKKVFSKKPGGGVARAQQLPTQTLPPMPATLMNSAPVMPHVTMERGLLTIDAPNSTLSDVLSGVHNATGAAIEGATPSERVAVKLGPGNPEQVIAALLRGTVYDYVILGSLGSQDRVTRVLLTQKTSPVSDGGGPPPQNLPSPQQTMPQPTDETMPDRTVPDDAATQPNADGEPEQVQQPQQQQQQQQQQQPEQNQPKTPEQLFKELQQLEQQKQQK